MQGIKVCYKLISEKVKNKYRKSAVSYHMEPKVTCIKAYMHDPCHEVTLGNFKVSYMLVSI